MDAGWGPQNLYAAIPQLSELAHHGYVVASVEHRPSTQATAPAQIQDVMMQIVVEFLDEKLGR